MTWLCGDRRYEFTCTLWHDHGLRNHECWIDGELRAEWAVTDARTDERTGQEP